MIISSPAKSTGQITDSIDSFTSLLDTLGVWSALNAKSPLSRQHLASAAKLKKVRSAQKQAPYRSLRLAKLAERAADLPLVQCDADDRLSTVDIENRKRSGLLLTLVNGRFVPALSNLTDLPKGVEIFDLATAYGAFSAHLLRRSIEDEGEFFALFNAALANRGTVLFFPPGFKCLSPIHIVNFGSQIEPTALFSRLHIIAGAFSAFHIALSGRSCCGWQSDFLDLTLEEGARVDFDEKMSTDPDSFSFLSTRALLKKDAEFCAAGFSVGSHCTWRDINIKLLGENSSANVSATAALADHRRFIISVQVEHLSQQARSYQWIRSVLDDRARFSFCGKIFVAKKASQTKSYQLNNNLLLSDDAIADSQPNLQILNDDVKASHGATAGQIRDEDLFYLQSRGISLKIARSLLIRGFVQLGIDKIRSSSLRDEARSALCQLF